jgi:hypothetical protein
VSPVVGDWAFRSDPADCDDIWGFVPISDAFEMSKMPIQDTKNDLFARLGGGPASLMLLAKGWRLPTVAEWDAFHALATHIEPVVLPTADQILGAGIALHDQEQIQRFRETHMMTREWCMLHDAEVIRRIGAANALGSPIDNCGKNWAEPSREHPARPGHSLIYGWWTARARSFGVNNDVMIQEPSDFHDLFYVDYATTFRAVRARQ